MMRQDRSHFWKTAHVSCERLLRIDTVVSKRRALVDSMGEAVPVRILGIQDIGGSYRAGSGRFRWRQGEDGRGMVRHHTPL